MAREVVVEVGDTFFFFFFNTKSQDNQAALEKKDILT